MKIMVFFFLALITYVYIGYPLLLMILSFFVKYKINKKDITPKVSFIIAAYNEEQSIEVKIKHCLDLDYSQDNLEIIIVSDGSTDSTDDIVKKFSNNGVKLLRVEGRKGKTEAQNQAVQIVHGEIVIFTDATTTYNRDVIKKIVRNFADSKVGCVGGELVYLNKSNTGTAEGGGLYWKYEKKIKSLEGKVCSLIGVSGCLYAVRKSLYENIPADQISDFIIAQIIYKKGFKIVYEPEAISFEELLGQNKEEFNMRVRVALRSLHGLRYMSQMFNPLKYGFYAVQLLSHKLLRYGAPLFLILIFVLNLWLLNDIFFVKLIWTQTIFYCLALVGKISGSKNKILFSAYYFCLVNFAALYAIIKFIMGKKQITWETVR